MRPNSFSIAFLIALTPIWATYCAAVPDVAPDAPAPTQDAAATTQQARASTPSVAAVIKVNSVTDNRQRDLVDKSAVVVSLGLRLSLNVQQPEAMEKPSGYGDWHIVQATDDRGTDLRAPPPSKDEPNLDPDEVEKELENARSEVGSNWPYQSLNIPDTPQPSFDVDVVLGTAPRAAKRITKLRGDFSVFSGGKQVTLNFPHLTTLYGKPLADANLKSAGLAIEPLSPSATSKPKSFGETPILAVRFSGDGRALVRYNGVEIVDKSGQSIAADFVFGIPDQVVDHQVAYFLLKKPVDNDTGIRIRCFVGRTVTVLPFDLSDIPLP